MVTDVTDSNPADPKIPPFRSIEEVAQFYLLSPAPLPSLAEDFKAPPIIKSIDEQLGVLERRQELLLPDLRSFDSLAVFSDYSDKKRKDSDYKVYTLLFTSVGILQPVSEQLRKVRCKHQLPLGKELVYKDLRFGPLRRALSEVMQVADQIPGLLFSLVVHKNVQSFFAESPRGVAQELDKIGGFKFLPDVAETTLRLVHFIAYFSRVFGERDQKFFWMTDNDAIVANSEATTKLQALLASMIDHYCEHRFSLQAIATPFDKKEQLLEGLDFDAMLGVCDLVAGVLGPVLTQWRKGGPIQVKPGGIDIVHVLTYQSVFLKKLVILVEPTVNSGLTTSVVSFTDQDSPKKGEVVLV